MRPCPLIDNGSIYCSQVHVHHVDIHIGEPNVNAYREVENQDKGVKDEKNRALHCNPCHGRDDCERWGTKALGMTITL